MPAVIFYYLRGEWAFGWKKIKGQKGKLREKGKFVNLQQTDGTHKMEKGIWLKKKKRWEKFVAGIWQIFERFQNKQKWKRWDRERKLKRETDRQREKNVERKCETNRVEKRIRSALGASIFIGVVVVNYPWDFALITGMPFDRRNDCSTPAFWFFKCTETYL